MSADEAIRSKWASLDATDSQRRAYERFSSTNALLKEAEASGASADLKAELENECRLFAVVLAHGKLPALASYAPELKTETGIAFLQGRVSSTSPITRAFAARVLWLTD